MSMYINSAATGAANLLNLINGTNNTSVTDAQVSFGLPSVLPEVDAYGRNTSITVTAINNQGYLDSQTLTYRRLGLDQNIAIPDLGYEVTDSTTREQLKSAICASLNLIATDVDLVGTIARPEGATGTGNTTTIALVANENSLVYVGQVQITLEWVPIDTPLNQAWTVTALNGFDPVPNP